jgi:hypothetical protein
MDPSKDRLLGRLKHLFVFYGITIIAIVVLVVVANVYKIKLAEEILPAVWVFLAILFIGTLLVILMTQLKILDSVEENGPKVEKVADELEKIREIVRQVNQGTRLSEAAKTIAFRDADAQVLREVVFEKLQQKDFDTAYEIVDEITHRIGNTKLAEQLHVQADKYRDSNEAERMLQSITHIEKLLEEHQWAKASTQVELLIREYPGQDKAMAMRQRLVDKKEERKKVLLNAWDDAVKRQLTDRSLEILRDLDQYLTPNEGLALQEAARDVFRNKLHNLGVQFSLAVSGRQWTKALETGMEITRDFPNSRMAEEIRGKIDILKKHALQKA